MSLSPLNVFLRDNVGLLGESCKLYYARGSMLTGFVQQDLLHENHKCPCVASVKCLCPKTKIYAFSFENTKVLTCCRICIRITYVFLKIQSKLEVYFVELF